jgi:ADP-heptose:LPS heptosyltransferase
MGDMLQASPTISGLRKQYPDAKVTVLIDRQFAKICAGIPGIDEVYVVDLSMVVRCIVRGEDGIVEGYKYVDAMVKDMRTRKFDLVLNISSSPYTAILLSMIDAKQNRGWMADSEGFRLITDPWAMLFAAFVYHSNRDFNSLNLVDLLRSAAEVTEHPRKLMYNPSEDDFAFAAKFIEENGLRTKAGPVIAIQAGASQAKRQWSPVYFARLSQLLVENLGAKLCFVGSAGEQKIIDQIFTHWNHPNMVSALGKTSFGELSALLQGCDLLITGDTGPMHLSVAVGTPVVSLFLASALCFETGPYSAGNIVLQPQISCNPCNPNFSCARPDCHDQITPELVALLTAERLKAGWTPEGMNLPESVRLQSEVAIYVTDFDKDGFLVFNPLCGESARAGMAANYYRVARESYKDLWKEEFAKIPASLPPLSSSVTPRPEYAEKLHGVQLVSQRVQAGRKLLKELAGAVRDVSIPAKRFKELNMELDALDKNIEEIGMSYPVIGAIIRIFLMEKDNLRGDDVLKLASQTEELYSNLERRCNRFLQLFNHWAERWPLGDKTVAMPRHRTESPSMSMIL